MDLTESIIPRSDQLNADDLIAGPRTVRIVEVRKGNAEQPVNVVLDEFGPSRPFKPSKSMRRVMVAAWGVDSSAYAGERMTLFRDPRVKFGGDEVGGIRISHMSGIGKPLNLALTVTRGKRAMYVVQPLPDESKPAPAPAGPAIEMDTKVAILALFGVKGIPEAEQGSGVVAVVGRSVRGLDDLTEDEGQAVIARLSTLPDATGEQDQ